MRKNRTFRSFSFLSPKKQENNRQALREILFKPEYKGGEVPQSSTLAPPFSVTPCRTGVFL